MSRELKFRVWSEDRERYLDDCEIDYEHAILLACYSGKTEVEDGDDRYIIEQDTGLKDKNGEKIHEGDIIKVDNDKLAIPYEHKTEASEVFYSNSKTAFVYRTWYGEIPVGRHDTSVEVIGNIHENPELLGGGK